MSVTLKSSGLEEFRRAQNETSFTLHKANENGKTDGGGGNENDIRKKKGLNFYQCAFFVMGEIAGAGSLALPYAVLGTGWIGLVLIIVCAVLSGISGIWLSKSWTILEERDEKYRQRVRKPFLVISEACFGKAFTWVMRFCLHVSTLGGAVVYILLIAQMVQSLLLFYWPTSVCYWILIVCAIIVPLSWIGTPKDFWGLGVVASASVLLAAILIVVQCLLDIPKYSDMIIYPDPTLEGLSLAFGTIYYGFSGGLAFPTFQNDMKNRKDFPKAVILGFTGTLMVYVPVAAAGYFVYGNLVNANITLTISEGPIRTIVQILLIFHLFCAYVMIVNPAFQDLEGIFNIPSYFSVKRCAFRTLIVGIMLFVAESVPQFNKILNLLGGSMGPLMNVIMPCLFYWKLCSMKDEALWKTRTVSYHEMAILWEIVVISILAGIVATISAVYDIVAPDSLTLPCFISLSPPPQVN